MRGYEYKGAEIKMDACLYCSLASMDWPHFLLPWLQQLGAQRFVNYWESRRQVFGPVKFVWRMTLSEALCDDLDAIETCVCRPLSNADASGRQLLLVSPGRHTRVGYSRESMV
jgi:hypothetical protein